MNISNVPVNIVLWACFTHSDPSHSPPPLSPSLSLSPLHGATSPLPPSLVLCRGRRHRDEALLLLLLLLLLDPSPTHETALCLL